MSFFDQTLYNYAMSMLGKPYIWGGDDQIEGFDCSGLVIELLQSVGEIPLGRDMTAQGIFETFCHGMYKQAYPDFGSLIFWGNGAHSIRHVAFGIDQTRFIGAQGGGSRVRTREDAIRHNAYTKIVHLQCVSAPFAVCRPGYLRVKNV